MIGKFVLVRTCNAGVHCGRLAETAGQAVLLKEARRVWRWRGANTLHELSLHGADYEWTRISEVIEEILLLDALEIIPCAKKAEANLKESRWSE